MEAVRLTHEALLHDEHCPYAGGAAILAEAA